MGTTNTALGLNIVTQPLLDLCKSLYDRRGTCNLPWSQAMSSFSPFTKVHGPMFNSENCKVYRAYILLLNETKDFYVGQSVSLSLRIRNHLHIGSKSTRFVLKTLEYTQDGKVQTCIVTEDALDILNKLGITHSNFLNILEQYVLLLTQPTLNEMFLIRTGGVRIAHDHRVLVQNRRKPIYI